MSQDIDASIIPQPFRIVTEHPPTPKKTMGDRLKDIGIIGIAGTIFAAAVGTAFQYARWHVEQQLERHAEDFKAATKTFDTLNTELSKAQTLQEMLYFTYSEAAGPVTQQQMRFLRDRAAVVFPQYEDQRMLMRQKMDSLIFDVQRHLDWASAPQHRDLSAATGVAKDPLSYGKLKVAKFDCTPEQSMPHFPDLTTLDVVRFDGFDIDWKSIKHHLVVYNYCFRKIHDALEPVRVWAAAAKETTLPATALDPAPDLKTQLDNNVQRLNGISMLGMIQVERVRELNTPPDPFYYVRARP